MVKVNPHEITNRNGIELLNHYCNNLGWFLKRDRGIKLKRVSPYERHELIYWGFKILTMPIVGFIFILILLFTFFRNPVFGLLNSSLLLMGSTLAISVLREHLRGWKYKIMRGKVNSKKFMLNYLKSPESNEKHIKIGFVGDIMMMKNILIKKYQFTFNPKVKQFFNDVDIIIGNLEGIISEHKGPIACQTHYITILSQLKTLLSGPDAKWLLCVSNNHSADLGLANFNYSSYKIQWQKQFYAFGRKDLPNVLINNGMINIASASEWSNQDHWDYISRYIDEEIVSNNMCCKFNALYPHWGYENERYARKGIQTDAIALLTGQNCSQKKTKQKIKPHKNKKWDLIFGHHPHVRQPIMKVWDTITTPSGKHKIFKKLVVFSGGNFTSGSCIFRRRKHVRGIILKCDIGPLAKHPEKFAIGKVEWENTINKKIKYSPPTKEVRIDIKNDIPYNVLSIILSTLSIITGIVLLIIRWICLN